VSPPSGYPAVSSLKIMPTDPAKMLSEDVLNKKKFSELFGG
jgi:iron(III) transport system substrate-binding protein